MKTDAHIIPLFVVAACTILMLSWTAPALAAPPDLQVEPHRLRITESFHGRTVFISAEIPQGAQAVIELKGQAREEHLLRKGRQWGVWMNVGEISVRNAPSLYLAMTTDSKLLSKQDPEDRWGYGALRKQVKFSGSIPQSGESDLFKQFLGFKESEGLYGVFPGALKVVSNLDNEVRVQGQLRLPGNINPGDYRVVLSILNNGKIVERRSIEFSVVMRRLAAFLRYLAMQHPTLYGLLAVVIAMAMGLLMGFVFKGKGAH